MDDTTIEDLKAEGKRLCAKYNVSTIDEVLEIQKTILERLKIKNTLN